MKKIIELLSLAAFVILITACEKNSGINIPEPQLKVTESNVIFEALGGAGFIKVSAPSALTATSNQEWCGVTVSGTTVHLAVGENRSMAGRTATISIKSGAETTTVTAIQSSNVFWFKDLKENDINFPSEGGTVKSALVSNFPVTVESKPDWIACDIRNDSIYISTTAGPPRKGRITFSSAGGRLITYNLSQISYNSFLGEWEMKFMSPFTGKPETKMVTLVEKESGKSYLLKGLVIIDQHLAEIEVTYSPENNQLLINGGQYLATINQNFVYLCMRASPVRYTWGSKAQLAGTLDITKEGLVYLVFADSKANPSFISDGFLFAIFSGQPPSKTTSTGKVHAAFVQIVLEKK